MCLFLFTNRFSIIRDDMLSIEFKISSSRFCCCDLKPFDLTRQQDCLWYGLCHSLQTKYPQHMSGECTHFVSHCLARSGGRFCVCKSLVKWFLLIYSSRHVDRRSELCMQNKMQKQKPMLSVCAACVCISG